MPKLLKLLLLISIQFCMTSAHSQEELIEQLISERARSIYVQDSLQHVIDSLQIENAFFKEQAAELSTLLNMQLDLKVNSVGSDSTSITIGYELPVETRKKLRGPILNGLEIIDQGKLVYQIVVDQGGNVVNVRFLNSKSTIGINENVFEIDQRIRKTVKYEPSSNEGLERFELEIELRKP